MSHTYTTPHRSSSSNSSTAAHAAAAAAAAAHRSLTPMLRPLSFCVPVFFLRLFLVFSSRSCSVTKTRAKVPARVREPAATTMRKPPFISTAAAAAAAAYRIHKQQQRHRTPSMCTCVEHNFPIITSKVTFLQLLRSDPVRRAKL
ncbi:unnamed protein product [Trichogramma brassicae]|uniref:Uncharacterized protein n=1 Tax=Trichogramma brassicae TaxID=86971 RepID=A0A6H5ITM4_9HYME|nr:unnamed protein product [Trichogramma brassicae]